MTDPGMDCIDLVEVVTDYLEGRMAPAEVARFEAHLRICEGCEAYVEQIRALMRLGEHARDEALPPLVASLLPAFRTYRRGLA
jgi:predicted anti-sigma-YlaC factor YlaD